MASGARVSGESTIRQSMEGKKQEEDAKYFKLIIKTNESEVKTLRQKINESLKKES
jgi:hypothetical protein